MPAASMPKENENAIWYMCVTHNNTIANDGWRRGLGIAYA